MESTSVLAAERLSGAMAVDPFEHAHRTPGVVWMSQNTNYLPGSPRIRGAVLAAMDRGLHHQYPLKKGLPGLPQLVRDDLGTPNHDVLITHGGLEASYILWRAVLSPGDEVVASDPSFLPIHAQIRLSEATPVELPIYAPPWKLTVSQIRDALTDHTRAILLIDPINPLGTAYTRDEVRAIAELARERSLLLVHDVTYRDFAQAPALATEFYPENTVLIYSFSKWAGLAGLRVGALVGPPDWMAKCKPYDTNPLGVNVLAQAAAKAALETKKEWLPGMLRTCRENQALIKDAVAKIEGAFLPVYPSHANLFVIDVSATGVDPAAIEEKLLFEHGVFVRGGAYVSERFGRRFVRVSFTVPAADCKRFAEAFPRVVSDLRR